MEEGGLLGGLLAGLLLQGAVVLGLFLPLGCGRTRLEKTGFDSALQGHVVLLQGGRVSALLEQPQLLGGQGVHRGGPHGLLLSDLLQLRQVDRVVYKHGTSALLDQD